MYPVIVVNQNHMIKMYRGFIPSQHYKNVNNQRFLTRNEMQLCRENNLMLTKLIEKLFHPMS